LTWRVHFADSNARDRQISRIGNDITIFDVLSYSSWIAFNDKDQEQEYLPLQPKFENASVKTLRSHFTSWPASQDSKHGKQMWPEHYMFLVVDREVLDNIHDQNPENNSEVRNQEPFIKAFDSDASGDGLDYPG